MLYEYEDAPSEFALNEERNRQARIKAAEDEARAKREADQARRAEVIGEITEGLRDAVSEFIDAEGLAEAIMAGRIPHVKVEM